MRVGSTGRCEFILKLSDDLEIGLSNDNESIRLFRLKHPALNVGGQTIGISQTSQCRARTASMKTRRIASVEGYSKSHARSVAKGIESRVQWRGRSS